MGKIWTVRTKSELVSFQVARRPVLLTAGLSVLALLLFVVSLSAGSTWVSPSAVVRHIAGYGTGEYAFVLDTLRLPRTLLAFLTGASLGVSGLLLQGLVRNPLASPDMIGITSGASVGAVLFIGFLIGTFSIVWLPAAAIAGATLSASMIYVLSWKKGVTPIRLVLMGIGIAALMKAFVTAVLVFSETAVTTKAFLWLTGSLYGAAWTDVQAMLPLVLLMIPLAFFFGRQLNAVLLGDDVAAGLGMRLEQQRILLLSISVVLAGTAVAFAGGIEFVGLVAPHISRMLAGRMYGVLVPVAALVGGMIVMIADIVARTAFLPLDIPAGVFTAGIGAPFFIYLLYRNRHNG